MTLPEQRLRARTLLVIHRPEGSVALVRSCLGPAGFRVAAARDGPATLDLLRHGPPAGILFDLLPSALTGCPDDHASGAEMGGRESLRCLRRQSDAGLVV